MQRSFFVNYEQLVLRVARIALVLLATASFLVVIGAFAWLAYLWIKPIGVGYKDTMVVPEYESIDSTWRSTLPRQETSELTDVKFPPVFDDILASVDQLYQLVGRNEEKFSEREGLGELYTTLIEPFGNFDQPKSYTTDFLLELKFYSDAMVKDELLKRIADVDERTTTIVNSIFRFRNEYIENLHGALDSVAERSSSNKWNRMVTSILALQVVSICITAFVVSTICLLGFHVVSQRAGDSTAASDVDTPFLKNE